MKKLVNKEISSKILMVGEYFKNNAPGGMAAVLASYDCLLYTSPSPRDTR